MITLLILAFVAMLLVGGLTQHDRPPARHPWALPILALILIYPPLGLSAALLALIVKQGEA